VGERGPLNVQLVAADDVACLRKRRKPEHQGAVQVHTLDALPPFAFVFAVPGRAIPRLLAEDPASDLFVGALVMLGVGVVFVSLKRRGSGRSQATATVRRRKRSSSGSLPSAERVLNHPIS
jgi:hypothetical protein